MVGAGDHVDPDIGRQIGVIAAGRLGVHQRSALLSVLGRTVGLDDERVGHVALEDRAGLARKRVGCDRVAEREPVLRIEAVLLLGRGAPRHAEAVVGKHLAGAGDMAHHAVEDAPPMPVVVHPELEEVAQKTTALRDA